MIRTVRDLGVEGKRVLVRVDFNVPLQDGKDGRPQVANDKRIRAALPTIEYLINSNAKVVLISHLGRPKGKFIKELKMDPVAERLSELLGRPVLKTDDCLGEKVKEAIEKMKEGDVVLLENVRFHAGETANDEQFAKALATLADLFVNDAFGTAHRRHASNYGIAKLLPAAAGLLMEKEIKMLNRATEDPKHPFMTIVGGKKAEDKIGVLLNLLGKVDTFLIGGGVAFTFLKVKGYEVGKSVVDESMLNEAQRFVEEAYKAKVDAILPVDVQVAQEFSPQSQSAIVKAEKIPSDWMGLDIGPETARDFSRRVREAKTILWTGPLGAFELPKFIEGTKAVAKAVADADAFTIIGGGETATAIEELGLADKMDHVSTGGGACLHFLRGKKLPAIEALKPA